MSESDVAANDGVAGEAAAAEPVTQAPVSYTAGEQLRQAREAAGVDLAALAVALKVSVKKLEALEADRLDQLPDAVFVRALASSVCRALKIDAAPVLGRLPQTVAPRLDREESGLNTPFHTPGDVAKTPFLDRMSRPMVLAALAVLMGALVLIFFPSSEQRAEIGAIVARPPADTPQAVVVPAAPETTPAPELVASPAKTPAAPVAPAKAVPAPAPQAAAAARPAPAPAPAAVAPVATPVAAPATGDAPVRKKLSSTGVVVFKTSGPAWIEVTDANGAVQLSRMVEPGEPVGASGPLPLNVTIGRAEVTEVQVRGKPYPLDAVTRGGVARFEVK